MSKTYEEWLKYYENATKEQVIEDVEHDNLEIERLNNIIKEFGILIKNEINESKLEEDYERVDSLEYCLATLQELKGSDKECI